MNRYFQIDNITNNVINRVSYQIIQSILRDLGISKVFNDDDVTLITDDLKDSNKPVDHQIRTEGNRCNVTLSPILNNQQIKWDINNFNNLYAYGVTEHEDRLPLFSDTTNNVKIWEYEKPYNLRYEFSLLFKDKNVALKAMSALTTRYHGSGRLNIHDIGFSYPLSLDILTPLFTLYKMIDKPTDESAFVEWLRGNSFKEIAIETDTVDHKNIVVKSVHLSSLAELEFDQERPEALTAPVGLTTERWELRFTYTLQFSCPDTLRLYFPSVINNTFVPQKIVVKKEPEDHLFQRQLQGRLQSMSFYKAMSGLQYKDLIVKLPYYEDFYPTQMSPQKNNGYKPFLISSFTFNVDETTNIGTETIDLETIPGVTLDPNVLELMRQDDLLSVGGIFNIVFYVDGKVYDYDKTLRDGLTFPITTELHKKRWHYVLYEATKFDYLSNINLELLLNYRYLFPVFIVRYLNKLIERGFIEYVPSDAMMKFIYNLLIKGVLDIYLQKLIDDNHINKYIFTLTGNVFSLCDFLITQKSQVNGNNTLWDELKLYFIDQGLSENKFEPKVYLKSGKPISFLRKERYEKLLHLPKRVMTISLTANR